LTKETSENIIPDVSAAITNALGASREEIVNQLRMRGGVNADELAASLGVSKQCVRKHLDVLERDGYVQHIAERQERGRPAHVYRLTPKADALFPKRYDLFAKAVLQQIGAVWGERGLNTVFCGCANEMIGRLGPQLKGLAFDARVVRLAELLDGEGYEAEVEKLEDGSYLLTEWNCPMTDVARDYRQVCERELEVYRELLGTQVFRESRIAVGASRCMYRVLRPEKQ
jgi:predicted ArsR family transcriptional regulator